MRFPRLYVAASLKPKYRDGRIFKGDWFSAALCRGLIEASTGRTTGPAAAPRFPRLYVAASLKRLPVPFVSVRPHSFPRLYVAASLKQDVGIGDGGSGIRFSAALCRGLIEA